MDAQSIPLKTTGIRFVRAVRTFAQSDVGWKAKLMFAALILLLCAANALNVVNSYVGRNFMTAIADRDMPGFVRQAFLYIAVFAALTFVAVIARFGEEGGSFKKIIREIYNTWLPLIPEEARPPLNKSGETQIRFIILPNGKIGGMVLEGSTHDDAINRAAWGSITGVGQFPPLPGEFHGPDLELRIHYLVNKSSE